MAQEEELDCPPTLGMLWQNEFKKSFIRDTKKNRDTTENTLTAIDNLLEEAGYCAAVARAGGTSGNDRQRFIMEWHSMNQWLSRIAGFMALNIRQDFSMDWKKEYELFLEVYE